MLFLRGPLPPAQAPAPPAGEPSAHFNGAAPRDQGGRESRPTVSPADESDGPASTSRYARLYQEFLGMPPPAPSRKLRVEGSLGDQPLKLDVPADLAAGSHLNIRLGTQPLNLEVGEGVPPQKEDHFQLSEIANAASLLDYPELQYLIALVDDPIDSRLASEFDLSMSAIQLALTDAGYLLDRKWLPWAEPEAAAELEYRDTAGLLLFRCNQRREREGQCRPGSLLGVFIVGETPKRGIHKRAFRSAVDFIAELARQRRADSNAAMIQVPILGPSFSGSADSLRIAVDGAVAAAAKNQIALRFRAISGSATRDDLVCRLSPHLHFGRTVVSDKEMLCQGLSFFRSQMGWDLGHAALLVESDTSYGADTDLSSLPCVREASQILRINFPSGLFELRNAWETAGGFLPPDHPAAKSGSLTPPKTALDVSLADAKPPLDVIQELSPLTPRIGDMAISNLGRQIARESIAYIGILATDPRDELFLAEQVRRWVPNAVLFLVDSDLLYLHPQYDATMYGAITLSSYPLAPEGADEQLSPATTDHGLRRQFSSEWQEGTYLALSAFLGKHPSAPLNVWISAVGNYGMWPIAHRQADNELTPDASNAVDYVGPATIPATRHEIPCPQHPEARDVEATSAGGAPTSLPDKTAASIDFQLLVLLLAVCLASWRINRAASSAAAQIPGIRPILSAALAICCLAGASLAALWFAYFRLRPPQGAAQPGLALYFCPLVLAGCCYLAWQVGLSSARWLAGCRAPVLGAVLCAGIAVIILLVTAPALCASEPPVLLYNRLRSFRGGMSPLVSLAWLAGAVVAWLCVEIKRQEIREILGEVEWPLEDDMAPALEGTAVRAGALADSLANVIPRRHRDLALLIVGVPALGLLFLIQPIAESRMYGRTFVLVCAAALCLSVSSFLRFLDLWHGVRPLLKSLADTEFFAALKRISREVGWQPTRFGPYSPSFTVLRLAADRLQELTRAGMASGAGKPEDLAAALKGVAAAGHHNDNLAARVEARGLLERRFAAAGRFRAADEIAAWRIYDFLALRLVIYLRLVIGQLRYLLLSALASGLPLILAAAFYAFQPKRLVLLILGGMVGAAVVATLIIFVEMDRDATLSAIAGTTAGKVTYDWSFFSNVSIYGVLPLLGLVTSQFPDIGRMLNGLLDPIARLLGST